MERKGYHALLARKVDADDGVVPCRAAGREFSVSLGAAVHPEILLYLLIRNPDGTEAGGLGRHHVDSVAEVNGKVLDAGTGEFEHLVLDESALENGLDKGYGHVVGTDSPARAALKPDEDDLGGIDVPGIAEQLLYELAAAFAHAHASEGAVTGVAVGAENHVAAG